MALSTLERLHEGPLIERELRVHLCRFLVEELGQSIFDMWFSDPRNIEIGSGSVTILGDSDFSVHRLATKLSPAIERAVQRCLGSSVSLHFERRADEVDKPNKVSSESTAASHAHTQRSLDAFSSPTLQGVLVARLWQGPRVRGLRSRAHANPHRQQAV